MKLILASQSPRRREIFEDFFGDNFVVEVSDVDETLDEKLTLEESIMDVARRKALVVAQKNPQSLVVGCDTVVELNKIIYGKPANKQEAIEMLKMFSGKKHNVITAVSVIKKDENIDESFAEITEVEFYCLSEQVINYYINTLEYKDKAGAYGIQGFGKVLVKGISGDFYNVMGFPAASFFHRYRHLILNFF